MDPFLYIGKVSNLVSALEGHHESVHQPDNTIVKEHGMDDIKDTLANDLSSRRPSWTK